MLIKGYDDLGNEVIYDFNGDNVYGGFFQAAHGSEPSVEASYITVTLYAGPFPEEIGEGMFDYVEPR